MKHTFLFALLFAGISLAAAPVDDVRRAAGEAVKSGNIKQAAALCLEYGKKADQTVKDRIRVLMIAGNYVHRRPDRSVYPVIRDCMEQIIAMPEASVAEKIQAYERIILCYRNAGETAKTPAVYDRMLKLDLNDAQRVNVLSAAGSICLHSLRKIAEGKAKYNQAAALLHKMAESADGAGKIAHLRKLVNIYQHQLRDMDKLKQVRMQIVAVNDALAPTLNGHARFAVIRDNCALLADLNETEKRGVQCANLLREIQAFLKEHEKESGEAWMKAVQPSRLVLALPAGYPPAMETIYAVAERTFADAAIPAKEKALTAQYARARAKSVKDPANEYKYFQRHAEFANTGEIYLQLGEFQYRNYLGLENARKTFRMIRDTPAFSEKSRKSAVLWLDMLADE